MLARRNTLVAIERASRFFDQLPAAIKDHAGVMLRRLIALSTDELCCRPTARQK